MIAWDESTVRKLLPAKPRAASARRLQSQTKLNLFQPHFRGLADRWFDHHSAAWHSFLRDDPLFSLLGREHLQERLSIPGFLRARRCVRELGSPSYFMIYELSNTSVLTSPDYLERLNNPTRGQSVWRPRGRQTARYARWWAPTDLVSGHIS